jgi:hypothetical protein
MSAKMLKTLWIIGITMVVIASLSLAGCGGSGNAPVTVPEGA